MEQFPDADWAIVPRSHVVLDIEMKNGLDGESDLLALEAEYGPLPIGPATKTFNNGRHLWFKLPDGCDLTGQIHVKPGIEIKCKNGSVHIPPSMGYTAIREITSFDDIPEAPAWLIELWGNAIPVAAKKLASGEKFAQGERHQQLCSAAGKFRNLGLGEEGIFHALVGVRSEKCEDPESISDEELRGIAKSYGTKDADSFALRVDQKEPEAISVEKFFARKVEVIHRQEAVDKSIPVLDGKHLRPTPLIAEWVDWVLKNADRPQPELSLMAACVGLGCIIGRDITWNNTHANIYGLGLATSGSGKNAPLHSIAKAFSAAGFDDLVAASDFGSDVGMLKEIGDKPELVWAIDEISLLFENMNKPNCPGYISNITKNLLELSGCDPYRGKVLKGSEAVQIPNPYPCVIAFTQPNMFARVYTDRMVDNGLLGRFVVFLGEALPAKNYSAERSAPSAELIAALNSARKIDTTTLPASVRKTRVTKSIFVDEETFKYYQEVDRRYEKLAQSFKNTDVMRATLMARTGEKANKFSLIHAWSLNPADPKMTKESIDWGYAIMEYSNACLMHIATTRVNNPQEESVEYLYDCICRSGFEGIQASRLAGIAKRLSRTMRESIMSDLIDSGRIVLTKHKPDKGPMLRVYIADKYVRRGDVA